MNFLRPRTAWWKFWKLETLTRFVRCSKRFPLSNESCRRLSWFSRPPKEFFCWLWTLSWWLSQFPQLGSTKKRKQSHKTSRNNEQPTKAAWKPSNPFSHRTEPARRNQSTCTAIFIGFISYNKKLSSPIRFRRLNSYLIAIAKLSMSKMFFWKLCHFTLNFESMLT